MKRIQILLFLLLGLVVLNPSVHAGVLNFKLTPSSSTVTSGSSVIVKLFLVESSGTQLSDFGMINAGGLLQLDQSSTASLSPLTLGDVTINSLFDFSPAANLGGSILSSADIGFDVLAEFSAGVDVFSPPVFPTSGEVLLAEFNLQVSGAAGDFVTLGAKKLTPSLLGNIGEDLNFALIDYDAMITGATATSTITIDSSVVPEPGSMAIWACVIGVIGVRRRRRSA